MLTTNEVREVEVKVAPRLLLMNTKENVSDYGLARMIDPLTRSEVCRLESEVCELKKKVHELEGLMIVLESYKKVTENLACELGVLHKAMPGGIGHADAMKVVAIAASVFRVPLDKLMAKNRTEDIAIPRMVAMYAIRNKLGMTLQGIGGVFKKDHGTVLHAIKRVEAMLAKGDAVSAKIETVLKSIVLDEES